ncbi:MAG: Gfo/Idh/MocA family oxidoreductase [Chloroflexota bacterium]
MTNSLRWGILSTARINRRIIPCLKQASRSKIVAVASRDAHRADMYAQEWDIPKSFGSYDALLSSPDIDAVYISLPNSLHVEWAIKAANHNKHVLCEKPLALSVADVDAMAKASTDNQIVLVEALMYQMHPQVAKLKAVIENGLIGKVSLIRANFSITLPDDSGNFRLDKNMGAGSLWDVGSYPVSFANGLVGEAPEKVIGFQQTNKDGVEILIAGQLKYQNGVMAQIDSSFRMPYRIGAEIIGENGVIRIPQPWQPNVDRRSGGLIHIAPDDSETLIETPPIDPYLCQIQAVERAVFDGEAVPHTLEQSRHNIATINALYQSANQDKVVEVII